ncbi:hypothetical protein GC561_05335 [Salmonella enterica]|nr:hypothetical protein [Salmonella enterica]
MPFTFQIGNHSCQISERYLRDIIDNKREHVFSTCEKFIDFFRNIFTRRSLISDYREIYNLLCQKKEHPDIKGPFSPGPFSKTAGIWATQGTLFPSVALEEVETLLLGSRMNTLRESN